MRKGPNGAGPVAQGDHHEIDHSLKRLGTDYVDLYQIHRWDYETPIEETLEALHDVVKAGKARYIGASSMYAWQFAKALLRRRANGWTRFVSMQNHYNLLYREEEREMLPLCEKAEGIGVIPWSPLARGRLTRRWYEFEMLKQRAMAAIAHKAATGEIEIGERLEIMVPDPRSMARYAEHTPMAIETAFHVLHHEPITHAHELTMPVLMLGAKDDSLVPYEQTTMFFERVKAEKRLEAFEVGNHWLFYDDGLPRAAELVTDWFAQHLR
jgi:aryl-alcohol dehydrogenase-like predicted oxidoreductase